MSRQPNQSGLSVDLGSAVARSFAGDWLSNGSSLKPTKGLRALTNEEMKRLVAADGRWGRIRRLLLNFALAFAVATIAACDSTMVSPAVSPPAPSFLFTVGQCEAIVPQALPSGAEAGVPSREADGRVSWGVGPDRVVEAVNEFGVGDPATLGVPPDSRQWVTVRGERALVVLIGDEGVGQIAISWRAGDCPYTIWLSPGHTLDDGLRYAARF